MGFIYPPELPNVVRREWNHSHAARRRSALRLGPAVGSILETAYHATFLREEDRQLRFRIAYLSRGRASRATSPDVRVISFESPRTFSPEEIRRLAPATDFTHTVICVDRDTAQPPGRASRLAIWGLLLVGAVVWRFSRRVERFAMLPPDYLEVSSRKSGQLICSREGALLVMLEAGKLVFPPRIVRLPPPMRRVVDGILPEFQRFVRLHVPRKKMGDRRLRERCRHEIERYIDRLMLAIDEQRHGAMILIVPHQLTSSDEIKQTLKFKYPIVPWSPALWRSLIELVAMESGADRIDYSKEECQRAVDDSISLFAAATGVDGAVVVSDRWALLGFGTEVLHAGAGPDAVHHVTGGRQRRPVKRSIDSAGTRHRSAARFAFACRTSVALVVSQDGSAQSIAWEKDRVVAYDHTALRGYAP